MDRSGWTNLTDSERAVALLAAQSLRNREIAAEMHLSPHTVDFHLRSIYRKLDIHSRVELVRLIAEQDDYG